LAKLYYRYAVMNAGKSTQLLQIAYDYEQSNGRSILCLKPGVDLKAGDYIISRLEDGDIRRKCDFLIDVNGGERLYPKLKEQIENKRASVVLIDEAQFLSEENVWDLARVVTYLNVPVICFGLKVDALGKPFPGSSMLFALAQDIEEVTTRAICRLSEAPRKATMQLRLVDDTPVFEGAQVAIENIHAKYLPVSLERYIRLRDNALGLEPEG